MTTSEHFLQITSIFPQNNHLCARIPFGNDLIPQSDIDRASKLMDEKGVDMPIHEGPELDLTELFCIVSDAMPDLWTAKDMRALLDALGCDSPDEISVGCAQLRRIR